MGNLVGDQFFTGMKQLHPVDDLARARGPVIYIYGTRDRLIDPAALENLQRRLTAAGVPLDVVPIADGDHVFFTPALQRQVIDTAVAWIQRALPARPQQQLG